MAEAPNDLKIVLKKATDLLAMDKAMFGGKASSDPYVKFSCGGREVKSSTKKKTLNPVWDETLSLEVLSSEAELLVEVYDADLLGSDYIGKTVVAVGSLRDGAMSREVHRLRDHDGHDDPSKPRGSVEFELTWWHNPAVAARMRAEVDAHEKRRAREEEKRREHEAKQRRLEDEANRKHAAKEEAARKKAEEASRKKAEREAAAKKKADEKAARAAARAKPGAAAAGSGGAAGPARPATWDELVAPRVARFAASTTGLLDLSHCELEQLGDAQLAHAALAGVDLGRVRARATCASGPSGMKLRPPLSLRCARSTCAATASAACPSRCSRARARSRRSCSRRTACARSAPTSSRACRRRSSGCSSTATASPRSRPTSRPRSRA